MSIPRRALLACAIAFPLASAASAAPDCDGGTIVSLRLSATRLRLVGTITRAGAHHDTLLSGATPFHFELTDADDPGTVLYAVSIPADRFVTSGSQTSYDRQGTFPGSVILRDWKKQSDTVKVSIRVSEPIAGASVGRDLRAGSAPRRGW